MIRYVGSKNLLGKSLAPIIQSYIHTDSTYVEPFVGGANMITKIHACTKIGADSDKAIIALLDAISKGWLPPETVSEEDYKNFKLLPQENPLHGWAAFACSFFRKKWGGFARSDGRDLTNEQYRAVAKNGHLLASTTFLNADYKDLSIQGGDVVYCDPPYRNTLKYSNNSFNHEEFWEWAEDLSRRCTVLVSEYEAPASWIPVYQGIVPNHVGVNKNRRVESLFVVERGKS